MNEIVPTEILALGELATARYILRASPLGAFVRDHRVRHLIAEDRVFAGISPWIQVVSAMDGEEKLLEAWAAARPQIYQPLRAKAEKDLSEFVPFTGAGLRLRMTIRMAAYRRLDAAYCGRQTFGRTPELGSETYFFVRSPGLPQPIKVGTVISAVYEGDPKRDRELLEICGDTANVLPIEHAISGCFPSEDTVPAWCDVAAIWDAVAPLREWERSSKLSNIPNGWWFDVLAVPSGILMRPKAADLLAEIGHEGGLILLNRLGVCPFASAPAKIFLESRSSQVTALSREDGTVEDFLAQTALVRDLVESASSKAA